MKARLMIVSMDEHERVYEKTITTASESYEINNFSDSHGIVGGLESLTKNGYLIMVTNGSYNKIYLSDICSDVQKTLLSEFLMSNPRISFGKVIIYPLDGTPKKEISGNLSIVDIESFINNNTNNLNGNSYRVPVDNYKDNDDRKDKNK